MAMASPSSSGRATSPDTICPMFVMRVFTGTSDWETSDWETSDWRATSDAEIGAPERLVGEQIGRGKKLEQILSEMQMVAEGVWTTRALFGPESEARGIPMPIAEQVHAVLFEQRDPRKAVIELMRRELSGEMDGLADALA